MEDWEWLCSACGEPYSEPGRQPDQEPRGDSEKLPDNKSGLILGFVIGAAVLLVVSALAIATTYGGGGGSAPGAGASYVTAPNVSPLGSDSPVLTSIEVSRQGWPAGAEEAVLVCEDDLSAAAVAGPLATAMKGPLLLSSASNLSPEVTARLKEMGVRSVTVVDGGGQTDGYLPALKSAGIEASQIKAATPQRLSLSVAEKLAALSTVNGFVVVAPDGGQRAVVTGGFAAAKGLAVLVAGQNGALDDYSAFVQKHSPKVVVACATETALPSAVFDGKAYKTAAVDRIDGASLEEFATLFGEYAFAHGFEYERVLIVRKGQFPHALSAAPFAAQNGSALLVSDDQDLGASVDTFLRNHASSIADVRFIGPGGMDVSSLLEAARRAAETRISKDAIPLSQTDAASISRITSDSVSFTTNAAVESSLTVGGVLVSGPTDAAPDGLLRRITSIQHSGSEITVGTEQASLSDVILKGSFDIRVSGDATGSASTRPAVMMPASGARMGSLAPGTKATLLQARTAASDSGRLRIPVDWPAIVYETPKIKMPPDVGGDGSFKVKLDPKEAWEVWYVISSTFEEKPGFLGIKQEALVEVGIVGYLRHEYDLDYEVSFNIDWSGKAKPQPMRHYVEMIAPQIIEKETAAKAAGTRSVFTVGIVPVVLDSEVEPYAGFKGSLKGMLKGTYSKDIEVWVGARVRVDKAGLTPVIGAADVTPPIKPPTFDGELEAKFCGGVKISTKFYGIVGPYLKGELYFKGTYDTEPSANTSPMKLALGIEGTLGGEFEIFGKKLGSVEFDPISRDFWTYEAPELAGASPPSTTPGQPGQPSQPGSGAGSGSTSLVFDVSTSMDEAFDQGSKLDMSKKAGKAVVDIVDGAGDDVRMGIVQFSDASEEVISPTADAGDVKHAVEGLATIGGTNIRAGIESGAAQLDGEIGSRVMILLSDGQDTAGNTREEILAAADEAKSQGVIIYTIGFGDAGAIDEELLKEIASNPKYYSLADPQNATSIAGRFISSQVSSTQQVLNETSGSVAQGEVASAGNFDVPAQTGDLQAILYWPGSTLEIQLTDPEGVKVEPGYPGLEVVREQTPAQLFVRRAKPGQWKMSVFGKKTSMPEEPFYALAAFKESEEPPPSAPSTTTTPAAPVSRGGSTGDGGAGFVLLLLALAGLGGVGGVVLARSRSSASSLVQELEVMPSAVATESPVSSAELVGSDGTCYPLASGANIIGRSPESDVVLNDASVSRRHALVLVETKEVVIKDLGSTLGLKVAGVSVKQAALHDGDRVMIGSGEFTFRMLRS